MVKMATLQFGPIGKGWGYDIVEERLDDTGPIFDKETNAILNQGKTHTIRLRLWYKIGEEKCSVEHFGHTKYIYKSKYGVTVDEEAPKKSLTDALKKCLSMLGFSADIFLGEYDNKHYVDEQRDREALEKTDNKIEELAKQEKERAEWVDLTVKLIGESKTESMLEGIYKESMRKAKARGDTEAMKAFKEAKEKVRV
jgi:hypothetical protein